MKKINYFLFLFILFISLQTHSKTSAQVATTTTATLQNTTRPGFEITYRQSSKTVRSALLKQLKKKGIRAKKKRHTIICKGAQLRQLSNKTLDLYFRIKKENKHTAQLLLFLSEGYDNFISPDKDTSLSRHAKKYLRQLSADVDYYAVQQSLKQREKDLQKAKSNFKKLTDKKEDWVTTLDEQTTALKSATGKEAHKAQKKIKKANRKIGKIQKKSRREQQNIDDLKDKVKELKKKRATINKNR